MKELNDKTIGQIDASKRETLDRLAKGAAFATPIVASFAMDGLKISKAQAQVANGSGVAPT
ncbi:hypothetical protein E8L99_19605 [Phreatobacter aquaticus]|uniref:Uncharacterized protein n=1 Tax=Phreatobacter aquaticus TaxID=2570229 RepID=A0A4D7QV09_9HYPH|nr:hypothetical protein [Phreatobacter aquaticus]QCK87802.1 hypothetical protein E8L99_19605 [Phreatobacter aquaticus]